MTEEEREALAESQYGMSADAVRSALDNLPKVQQSLNEIIRRHFGDPLLESIALVTNGPAALLDLPVEDRIPTFLRACDTIVAYHKSMQVLQ